MRSWILVSLSSFLLLWAGAPSLAAQEGNPRLEALRKANYTLVEGVIRALRALPGTVVEAEAEVKKGEEGYRVSYKVVLFHRGKVWSVVVDGRTGKVEETRELGRVGREAHEEEEGEEKEKPRKAAQVPAAGKAGEGGSFQESFESPGREGIPKGWIPAETNGVGRPGLWKSVKAQDAPQGERVMALARTTNRGHTFNLLLTKRTFPADLTLSVRIKAGTGREDQGGGLVWRARSGDDYYVTRWNPLEDNLRLYRVVGGRRSMITGVRLEADPRKWHRIAVKTQGERIQVFFDGKKMLEARDGTFRGPGRVGLWTKADAASCFDDFRVTW